MSRLTHLRKSLAFLRGSGELAGITGVGVGVEGEALFIHHFEPSTNMVASTYLEKSLAGPGGLAWFVGVGVGGGKLEATTLVQQDFAWLVLWGTHRKIWVAFLRGPVEPIGKPSVSADAVLRLLLWFGKTLQFAPAM